jgi:hypothetical protein
MIGYEFITLCLDIAIFCQTTKFRQVSYPQVFFGLEYNIYLIFSKTTKKQPSMAIFQKLNVKCFAVLLPTNHKTAKLR